MDVRSAQVGRRCGHHLTQESRPPQPGPVRVLALLACSHEAIQIRMIGSPSDGSTDHGVTRLIWQGIQAAFESVGSPPEVRITWDNIQEWGVATSGFQSVIAARSPSPT